MSLANDLTGLKLQYLLLATGLVACTDPPPAEWVEAGDHRSIALDVDGGRSGFREVDISGIDFVGVLSDSAFVENRHRVNGAGVAIGDVDGDDRPDVFLAGLEAGSRLYRNLGDWRFEDMTDASGLALGEFYHTGAAFMDTDGDNDLDLVATTLDGPSMLWLNDGQGRFSEDVTWPGRAIGPRGGTTITAADVDSDGDLDIYVANYKRRTVKDLHHPDEITFENTVVQEGAEFAVKPPYDEHYRVEVQATRVMRYEYGEPDLLAVNQGGVFRDGTAAAFPEVHEDWGLAAQFRDLDNDGDPDLYVCNDFESPDHIWLNDGRGRFSATPMLDFRHTPQSSMAVDGADVNRDGTVDLFVTEMLSRTHERRLRQVGNPPPILPAVGEIEVRPQVMHNALFLGDAAGGFLDAAWAFDVAATEWSWSTSFLDVDLDGWEDLLVTTGHRYDAMDVDAQTSMAGRRSGAEWVEELLEFPPLDLQNVAFRNIAGTRFEEVADGWGLGKNADVSHGMAFGDLDGDGDLDIVTNRLNAPAGVFENATGSPRVAVRLKGPRGNTWGIGAKIRLQVGQLTQEKEVIAGGQYLSGSQALAVFAALADTMHLTVNWPDGSVQRADVTPNRLYEFTHLGGGATPVGDATPPLAWGLTELALHHEPFFEDRAAQPLLTRRLSQEGPFVAIGDLDGDEDPDVAIGTGRDGQPAIYLNTDGNLEPIPAPTVAFDMTGGVISHGYLIAAESGYEQRTSSTLGLYKIGPGSLGGTTELSVRVRLDLGSGSPGPLAAADVDGDGDEDLFVGMRFLPGRYPESAPSALFMRDGDGLSPGGTIEAGMVTGVAFLDADGDGDQDLALSTEWGPVRLLENDGLGGFIDRTEAWGLAGHTGLWRSIAVGDLNGDGLPDLVTPNWAWNSPFGRVGAPDYRGPGVRLYSGDFDRNGSMDPVEAEYSEGIGGWGPTMKLMDLVRGLRYVSRRIGSMGEYAGATMEDILGPSLESASISTLTQLGHVVWLNRGGSFSPVILPDAAQLAASSGVAITDVNGDGNKDIVLSQNFFPVLPEEATRQDAGRGLVLLGDGTGAFESGFTLGLFGDGRGIAARDLNEDGVDEIVVGQNGGPAYLARASQD